MSNQPTMVQPTHRALLLSAQQPPPSLTLTHLPKPPAIPGSATIRILAVNIVPYMTSILNGTRPYPLSLPLVPGGSAIGRIDAVGADAVSLTPGQLVVCDITIRARDDADACFLFGIHGGAEERTRRLMDGEWRHATWAEYARVPLENLYAIDEDVVCAQLGYGILDLTTLATMAVPFGGLNEVGAQPGEGVVVAPATGYYGGAAVTVALAMGCLVVAAGRDEGKLEKLRLLYGATGRLKTVVLTGDGAVDGEALKAASGSAKGLDIYLDFSPPAAAKSSHIKTCLSALRPFGRAVLMGGIAEEISLPYSMIMFRSLRVQGRFMFEKKHMTRLIQMVERGVLKLGKDIGMVDFRKFGLEDWKEGIEAAAEGNGWGSQAVLVP